MHRRIYQAIRDRDPVKARGEMGAHLDLARQAQATEEVETPVKALAIVDLPPGT
jgi:DNA-binding FadR family transcriptional regulator